MCLERRKRLFLGQNVDILLKNALLPVVAESDEDFLIN